jgi:hypothetical protein
MAEEPSGEPTSTGTDEPASLKLIAQRVSRELAALNGHAESLDTKAGVVLGFAGVLVGLGATAQNAVSATVLFQLGLGVAVLAGICAAAAFFPRRYPVIEVRPLRDGYLAQPEPTTRLVLLDTEITMVRRAAALVRLKGRLMKVSILALVVAVALMVAGTLVGGGHMSDQKPSPEQTPNAPHQTPTAPVVPSGTNPAADNPAVPPFRPDLSLIGYIEKGQKPDVGKVW